MMNHQEGLLQQATKIRECFKKKQKERQRLPARTLQKIKDKVHKPLQKTLHND